MEDLEVFIRSLSRDSLINLLLAIITEHKNVKYNMENVIIRTKKMMEKK